MNDFFQNIFYFCIIAPIAWEFCNLTDTTKVHNSLLRIRLVKDRKYTETQDRYLTLMGLYIVWTLIGLFSSQYILFIVVLVLSAIPKKNI